MLKGKRVFALVLILSMAAVLFVGCGPKEDVEGEPEPTQTAAVESTASPEETNGGEDADVEDAVTATAQSTQKPSASPTAKPSAATPKPSGSTAGGAGSQTQKPTPTPSSTQKPSNTPAPTAAPTTAPTAAPTPTPTPAPSVSTQDLVAKMVAALPADSHNLTAMPADYYKDVYGIDPAQFESVTIYGSMMNVKSNEIIVIKAKDSAGLSAAKAALQNRKSALLQTWEHYLPDQYDLVQKSVIISKGLYVALVCATDQNRAVSVFNSAL